MINHHSNQRRHQNDQGYLLDKNAYLLCLHVKPTSLFCGLIIFIMSFMNIVILLSRFTIEFNPSFERNATNFNHLNQMDPRLKTNKLIILYIIAESLKLFISSLLIYGITRCKPSYLIPFFLMQLFYFFRSISFFLEHYANYQQNTVYRTDRNDFTFHTKQPEMQPQSYPIFIFFFSLLYKFYFITCVFKCYKYLKIKEATQQLNQNYQFRNHHQHQSINAISVLHQQANPPSYNDCLNDVTISKDDGDYVDQKLPSYDEAIKIVLPEPEKNEAANLVSTHLQNSTSITISNANESNKLSQNENTQV